MAFKFGNRSNRCLETCHVDLQVIAKEALARTPYVDWGVHVGHRTVEEQQRLYNQGRNGNPGNIVTHIDGVNRKSKHNYWPSRAFDFHIHVKGRQDLTWNESMVIFIAGIIMGTAEDLFNKKIITNEVRWGGNFNGNNIIGSLDKEFFDPVHIELMI